MNMETKPRRKWNIVDIVIIVIILAAAAFLVFKLVVSKDDGSAGGRPGTVRFVIEVDGLRSDLYEGTAALIPCQMAASGNLVEGYILETWSNPVTMTAIKAKSPVNASLEQYMEPEEGVDYVNAYYLCEADVDLNDNLNLTGNQEIRLGRSYYLKSVDLELSGTIISMEKFEK